MRILLLTHSFNSLAQRLHAELLERGHRVAVELDISDAVTEEAISLFSPDLVLAPFLKRAIGAPVFERVPCLIVHPGIAGDRGPSALDRAMERGESTWGVTVLQATADFDAGPIWAEQRFAMRAATKSSLYRREVTDAAVVAVMRALQAIEQGCDPVPPGQWPGVRGTVHPPMRQAERSIDWVREGTGRIVQRVQAADGFPGVLDRLFDVPCRLFDAHAHTDVHVGVARALSDVAPGTPIARRHAALLVKTCDGAVWIGQVQRADDAINNFKLPAVDALPAAVALPELVAGAPAVVEEIVYEEFDRVGWLSFDFYNGAASTAQCERLVHAIALARQRPTRVLVLAGGADFFCNGIHLNVIEAADSPAEESWRNILAMDEVARAVLECDDHLTISLLRGNAAAGGVFLGLAADQVWARAGTVLNPHYKNMGNLYGSEYWTYSLPRRVGAEGVEAVLGQRLPLLADAALRRGLLDAVLEASCGVEPAARLRARQLAAASDFEELLGAKRQRRRYDEQCKPLAQYRAQELEQMRRNFFGFDPSYHVARSHFVRKTSHSWTPRHLAVHRTAPAPHATQPV